MWFRVMPLCSTVKGHGGRMRLGEYEQVSKGADCHAPTHLIGLISRTLVSARRKSPGSAGSRFRHLPARESRTGGPFGLRKALDCARFSLSSFIRTQHTR